jgi:S-DNA-T family DNA segregation ATPase FtsK/SpoIIIE
VLGVPDAYHLPGAPGAAYLKVGSGEPVRFQSVTISAQRAGTPAAVVPLTWPVPFTATPLGSDAAAEHRAAAGPSLLDAMLDALAGHGAPAHPVWLPPLERSPGLGAVLGEARGADLVVPIGLADNVFEHRRSAMLVDLSGAAGHVAVVGAPQAGKTTALRTLVLALGATHDPRRIQLYCLDFGGGGLSTLSGLPHVGAVAGRRERELVARVVAEIAALTRGREARFAALGVDSMAEYRRRRAAADPATLDDPFGDVFLVIDGWAVLRQDFDTLDATVTALAAEGLSVGVHVVLSANRWADIRPALRDQIGTRVELRLGDPLDSEIDRARARNVPSGRPGRGLTGQGMPLTIALPQLDDADPVAQLAARHGGSRAPEIRALPTRVDHRTLAAPRRGLLLGVDEARLAPVAMDFGAQPHLLILGDTGAGKTATLRTLCHEMVRAAAERPARLIVVDPRRTLPDLAGAERVDGPAQLAAVVDDLLASLGARMAGRRGDEPDVYVVVDDYDLVSTANPNPLQALQGLVPHARDIGLHLVVARRSAGAARALYEPMLAAIRECDAMGLQMSVGTDEGPLLGTTRPRPLPPGRATLVSREAGEVLVQVAWIEPP